MDVDGYTYETYELNENPTWKLIKLFPTEVDGNPIVELVIDDFKGYYSFAWVILNDGTIRYIDIDAVNAANASR